MTVTNNVRVFDVGGVEKDTTWLAANYDGCHPEYVAHHVDLARWERYFALVAVYCSEGPAAAKVETRDAAGAPLGGVYGCMSWPSLASPSPDLQSLANSGAPHLWTARGVPQRTDAGGVTGFGLGSAYGPLYQMWIVSPSTPSDCLVGAGMKGGTNHRGPLHAVFQLAPTTVTPDPPPANEVDAAFFRAAALMIAARPNALHRSGPDDVYAYLTAVEVAAEAAELEQAVRDALREQRE